MSDETPNAPTTPLDGTSVDPNSLDWKVPDREAATETVPEPEPEPEPAPSQPMQPVWADPAEMAREMAMAQRQMPPPIERPEIPKPKFNMEMAQVNLEAATQQFFDETARYFETKFQERESIREARETATMVRTNMEHGAQLFQDVSSREPAMKDPRVAEVTRALIREAQVRGIQNPSGTEAFKNPAFHRAIIATAKDMVAQERGQNVYQGPPNAVGMGGARTLSPKQGSGAPAPSVLLSADERAWCAANGIPESEFAKNKSEALREQAASQPWRTR